MYCLIKNKTVICIDCEIRYVFIIDLDDAGTEFMGNTFSSTIQGRVVYTILSGSIIPRYFLCNRRFYSFTEWAFAFSVFPVLFRWLTHTLHPNDRICARTGFIPVRSSFDFFDRLTRTTQSRASQTAYKRLASRFEEPPECINIVLTACLTVQLIQLARSFSLGA